MLQKLSDYFYIEYGQHEFNSKRELIETKVGIPLISSKGSNRGVYGYYDIKPKYQNVISVPRTGTICFAYYQEEECCIDDNCLVLTPKEQISRELMIYFSLIIRKEKYKYMYGRQVTPERLGNTVIDVKIPQWIEKRKFNYSKIKEKESDKEIKIPSDKLREFKIIELFDIKGTKTTSLKSLIKIGKGKYPYVTTQATNNGVAGFFNKYTEEGNVITVDSAVLGFASYQEEKFSASDHVEKLVPKFKLNRFRALFLTALLNKEQYRYNYGRKASQTRLEKQKIKLPVDSNGEPDWQFMEDYIKSLPYSKALEN
ncbi:MAG: restriction endonuclease subunit S [Candidatus Pacearchaeota archaeon]